MQIPFFDMRAELSSVRAEIDSAIARVIDSGQLIGGPEVEAFERELATAMQASRAIGLSSGTDALHVLGMALEIDSNDEVVTTPLSFFATAGAFARLGARIVFADIDPDTLVIDPGAARRACSGRTAAVVVVNLFGRAAPIPDVPCTIIEDAAQSIGIGPARGRAAALSFFPTKNIGALGDAGAVVTDDHELADRVALLRSHGARPKYNHLLLGGNFRLDALQAAVLRVKLRHLDLWTARRRALALGYRNRIASAPLPPELRVPPPDPTHVYHHFVIRAPRRDQLRGYLARHGIGTEAYYPSPLHLQPCFAGYRKGSMPHAEAACEELIALPIYPALPEVALDVVVSQIINFYREL